MDIDLLIEEASLSRVKVIAANLGFTLDTGLFQVKKGAIKVYRLVKADRHSGDAIGLDLLLVTPVLRDVWSGREPVAWEGGTLFVVSRRGLAKMKSLRGSGQDRDDIRHLEGRVDAG